MRLKPSTYFALAIMVVMAAVVIRALTFTYYQPALLPVIFGSIVFIFAGIQAAREIRGTEVRKAREKPEIKGEEIQYTKGTSLGVFGAWFMGFALGVFLFGHLIAIPLFIVFYVRSRGKSWIKAMAAAACVTAGIYLLFPLALKVELYPGLIPELIFPGD